MRRSALPRTTPGPRRARLGRSRRLLAFGLIAAGLTGCATPLEVPLARRSEGLPSGNRGQSSSVVFSNPGVAAAMNATPDWVRPEYARNNDNLVYSRPRALTAIDSWPQVAPPSLERQRRTTIGRNPDQIIIFVSPDRGRATSRKGSGQRQRPARGGRDRNLPTHRVR